MATPLSHEERIQRLHLIEEYDLARNVTISGLALLQRCETYRMQHFLFLLALSSGIERLLKLRLMLQDLDERGTLPTRTEQKRFGHRIIELRDEVADRCFAAGNALPESIAEDRDFFSNDPLLNAVLEFLHDFGEGDRYVHLDGAAGKDTTEKWLSRRWEKIEGMTMSREEQYRLTNEGRIDEFAAHAKRMIVGRIERFLRALARTITHTGLGQAAKGLGTALWDFLTIRDEEFGSRTYEVINT